MSNPIDDLFKSKLNSRSFEYDESAWEDARLLIEKEENRKKRRGWIFSFMGLLLLTFVGVSAYQFGKGSTAADQAPSAPIQIDQSKPSIENTKSIAAHDSAIEIMDTDTNQVWSNQKKNSQSVPENNQTNLATNKTTSNKNRGVENTNVKEDRANSTTKSQTNFVEALGVDTDISVSNKPITTYSNPIYVTPATPEPSNPQSSIDHSIVSLMQMPLLSLLPIDQEDVKADLMNLVPALMSTDDGLPIVNPLQKWSVGLRAGAVLIPFDFSELDGGAFVSYNLNRNWSLSFQPHYTYQKLKATTLEVAEVYSFGLRASAYSLKAESIRSFHAPLMISYAFGSGSLNLSDKIKNRYLRNKVSLGISYIYLDGITGSVLLKEGANESSEFQTGWLDTSNFNRHNAEIIVGYERFFTKRLSLGVIARYRMKDQFSDSFTQQNPSIEHPSPLYFGIQSYFKLF